MRKSCRSQKLILKYKIRIQFFAKSASMQPRTDRPKYLRVEPNRPTVLRIALRLIRVVADLLRVNRTEARTWPLVQWSACLVGYLIVSCTLQRFDAASGRFDVELSASEVIFFYQSVYLLLLRRNMKSQI